MTTRDKIAHLLRRFGLGATPWEVDEYSKLGYDGALERLVNDADRPEPPANPSEFFWRDKEEADLGAWRVRTWWAYRMLTTERPLQEKLALFWHNHFAVSDDKVEDGPMMLDYLRLLQTQGQGRFRDLLGSVATNPAMMKYLDLTRSLRGNPNENWAREVMELFTLGIGNYSEQDVKEVARAFTGWGYVHTFWEMPGSADDKLRESLKYDRPFSSFAYMPAMHDPNPKTILGKTAAFDGEQVLDLLAAHPATARRLSAKLWSFFAYSDPEPHVVERLAKVWIRSRGDLRQVMLAMAKTPEFLSARCVRGLVKSPVDYVVPIARQMRAGQALAQRRPSTASEYDRIDPTLFEQAGALAWSMEREGLSLLYPPDVSGWRWDKAWVGSDMMVQRFTYRGLLLWGKDGAGDGGKAVLGYLRSTQPKVGVDAVKALGSLFDIPLEAAQQAILAKIWDDNHGIDQLAKGDPTWLIDRSMALLFATPEAHVC